MDFPQFDGKSDPLAFINQCETYFNRERIMEEEKVWMASRNLAGTVHAVLFHVGPWAGSACHLGGSLLAAHDTS